MPNLHINKFTILLSGLLISCNYFQLSSCIINIIKNKSNSTLTGFVPSHCLPSDYHDDFLNHPCNRQCVAGEAPRTCLYKLSATTFETHNPKACAADCANKGICHKCIITDGVASPLLVYNYKFPGPPIVVCLNDHVIVDVANHLKVSSQNMNIANVFKNFAEEFKFHKIPNAKQLALWETSRYLQRLKALFENNEEPTTIHWHAIRQLNNSHHDGVSFVTQQPIPRSGVYRYKFIADNLGTLFYHSHFPVQRGIGLAAPLIVKQANDPHANLYDFDLTEHIIMIQDKTYDLNEGDSVTLLINGQGIKQDAQSGDPFVFEVEPHKRYRFRVISNAINAIRITLWIKEMNVTLVAVDGQAIEAQQFSSIMMASAERLDFILNVGEQRDQPYWLHLQTNGRANLHQIAMIKFKTAPTVQWTMSEFNDTQPPEGPQLAWSSYATVADIKLATSSNKMLNLKELPSNLNGTCKQIFIEQNITEQGFQMNNITMQFPNVAFQNQVYLNGKLNDSNICTIDTLNKQQCEREQCQCEHLIKVNLSTCYELVVMGSHPFHLHGHNFYVLTEGDFQEKVPVRESFLDMDKNDLVLRNLKNPPMRDISMPPLNGFVVLRVFFDNPGFMAAHCHIEPHTDGGMFVVFQVGAEKEIQQINTNTHFNKPIRNNVCK